ncbi:uncharacterized protein LOC115429749 [Sphaeramia orbicularis]|uniref:Uncharacterized LOC115429749 n=1 Tax=Sphaeramia orbicularis TaxID=375764 RepID=A0A673B1D3_9TELE|nr:uncharacterized protein LOC115429749 [Sphaeramia orbicularis]
MDMSWQGSTSVSRKPFEWQLSDGRQWQRIDNDHVIETHYCQPGAKGISINTASHGKLFIDFDKMQIENAPFTVQRMSFNPQGQAEEIGWYFRDDRLWCEYGSQSSNMMSSTVSSKTVEHQFTLNPQGTFSFTVGSTNYKLDFRAMTQTNCITGMCRKVRRRPKFNSGSLDFTSAVLTDGGYKWEFNADEGDWAEYQAHICSFDSPAIERQYQLNPQGQLHFNIGRFSYTLNFAAMCQINNNTGTRRAVRRTPSTGNPQNIRSGSAPRWQFLDVNGWKEYSKGYRQCSVSSQDIELHYQQNPSGIMSFKTRTFTYKLDFSTMIQRNLSTNTTRSVRRLNQ